MFFNISRLKNVSLLLSISVHCEVIKSRVVVQQESFVLQLIVVLFQVTGKCGSVRVRLIPAPRGTGIVSAPVPKKLLQMAGIEDCYTSARGQTATLGNFGKLTLKFNFVRNVPN